MLAQLSDNAHSFVNRGKARKLRWADKDYTMYRQAPSHHVESSLSAGRNKDEQAFHRLKMLFKNKRILAEDEAGANRLETRVELVRTLVRRRTTSKITQISFKLRYDPEKQISLSLS